MEQPMEQSDGISNLTHGDRRPSPGWNSKGQPRVPPSFHRTWLSRPLGKSTDIIRHHITTSWLIRTGKASFEQRPAEIAFRLLCSMKSRCQELKCYSLKLRGRPRIGADAELNQLMEVMNTWSITSSYILPNDVVTSKRSGAIKCNQYMHCA